MILEELKKQVDSISKSRKEEVISLVIQKITERMAKEKHHASCNCINCESLKEYVKLKLKLHRSKKRYENSFDEIDDILLNAKLRKEIYFFENDILKKHNKFLDFLNSESLYKEFIFNEYHIKNDNIEMCFKIDSRINSDLIEIFLEHINYVEKGLVNFLKNLINLLPYIHTDFDFKKLLEILSLLTGTYNFNCESSEIKNEIRNLQETRKFYKDISINSINVVEKLF